MTVIVEREDWSPSTVWTCQWDITERRSSRAIADRDIWRRPQSCQKPWRGHYSHLNISSCNWPFRFSEASINVFLMHNYCEGSSSWDTNSKTHVKTKTEHCVRYWTGTCRPRQRWGVFRLRHEICICMPVMCPSGTCLKIDRMFH